MIHTLLRVGVSGGVSVCVCVCESVRMFESMWCDGVLEYMRLCEGV